MWRSAGRPFQRTKHLPFDSYTDTRAIPPARRRSRLLGLPDLLELLIPIALILIGLGLIAIEIYLVPGFNVIGIFGAVVILFAIGFAFSESGVQGGVAALVGTAVVGGGLFYWMWNSGAWDRFVLASNLRNDEAVMARESEHRAKYLGKSGTAVTPLRPTGVAEIEGERIEVVTEGEFIASGSKVRVVAMDRRRFFVRLADAVTEQNLEGS